MITRDFIRLEYHQLQRTSFAAQSPSAPGEPPDLLQASKMARNLSIIILETLFTALCVVLVLVNLKYNHGCGGYDQGATSRRVALERRLEAMEVEARENAALLHEVIMGLEDRLASRR